MAAPAGDEIRPARSSDLQAIRGIVDTAYAVYVPLMDKPPGPMLDDYAARIDAGEAYVFDSATGILGVLVLIDQDGYLLLNNVAVTPQAQGKSVGRRLVAFAESEARRRGYDDIRLYTHVVMEANVGYYEKLGWEVTGRGEQAGYQRIFMRKRL